MNDTDIIRLNTAGFAKLIAWIQNYGAEHFKSAKEGDMYTGCMDGWNIRDIQRMVKECIRKDEFDD